MGGSNIPPIFFNQNGIIMKNKMKNKNGDTSFYGFMCGYTQEYRSNDNITTLYHEGGTCYSIKTSFGDRSKLMVWDTEELLTDARKCFKNHIKTYHKKEIWKWMMTP